MPHEGLTIDAGNREKLKRPDRNLSTPNRFGNDFSDFEDLDAWEDDSETTAPEPSLRVVESVPEQMPVVVDSPSLVMAEETDEAEPSISAREQGLESAQKAVVLPLEEFPQQEEAGAPAEVSLSSSLGLSKVERIGLIALFALLLSGGGAMYWHLSRVPKLAPLTTRRDFPIQGQHLKFLTADSYWRQPKADEGVRRDTALVPVLSLQSSEGPATIRVLFRNEKGELVGDAVTRVVKNGSTQEIAATAGFDDVGMLAGYAANEDKPWIAQVFEAPADKTAGADFKKVFEMALSTLRR